MTDTDYMNAIVEQVIILGVGAEKVDGALNSSEVECLNFAEFAECGKVKLVSISRRLEVEQ